MIESFAPCPESGKVCFPKRDAMQRAKFLHEKGRGNFRVYWHRSCNWFHLTSERMRDFYKDR